MHDLNRNTANLWCAKQMGEKPEASVENYGGDKNE